MGKNPRRILDRRQNIGQEDRRMLDRRVADMGRRTSIVQENCTGGLQNIRCQNIGQENGIILDRLLAEFEKRDEK
jgi:hypothetical protein